MDSMSTRSFVNIFTSMLELNLPHTSIRLERKGSRLYIWDHVRLRWIVLTPEEWVRQHFTHWMVESLGYPLARMGHEISLGQNGQQRRADAVFYDAQGKPLIIMEFKAPHIQLSQKTFDQITRYNMVLQVPYLIVSNGMQHYCCHIDKNGAVNLLRIIPRHEDLI